MSAVFLTGATGYLGSYLAAGLLQRERDLVVLVRAQDRERAAEKLWKAWQLHFGFAEFVRHLEQRVRIVVGELTQPRFGLADEERRALVPTIDSVLHCAASLNRQSERSCMNVNLRGTLAVVRFAEEVLAAGGLRRFSQVSTVSVAGERAHETVREDEAIDWDRRDYDAYGRTKKFAEEIVRGLAGSTRVTIFRPSIVLGDSRRPQTTQFDMARAFSLLADMRVLPLRPNDRIDIVPADWVGDSIVQLHEKQAPEHSTYHISAGSGSSTYREITDCLATARGKSPPRYVPALERPFTALTKSTGKWGRGKLRAGARLLEVFLPYLFYDTVFDNRRVVSETGVAPTPFPQYCAPFLQYSQQSGFRYPHVPPSSTLREVGA